MIKPFFQSAVEVFLRCFFWHYTFIKATIWDIIRTVFVYTHTVFPIPFSKIYMYFCLFEMSLSCSKNSLWCWTFCRDRAYFTTGRRRTHFSTGGALTQFTPTHVFSKMKSIYIYIDYQNHFKNFNKYLSAYSMKYFSDIIVTCFSLPLFFLRVQFDQINLRNGNKNGNRWTSKSLMKQMSFLRFR